MKFSITHKVSSDADLPISATGDETGSNQYSVDVSFPAASVNTPIAATFTASGVQSVFMLADNNLTLLTNSTGSPSNTFNLVAGRPLVWAVSDGYFANPFSANVTGFYVSCTPSARLRIKLLHS